MTTLAIDIGGTKFYGGRLRGRSHGGSRIARDRPGRRSRLDAGADPESIVDGAANSTRCGIGFGGPVDFANQRVALSTHVGGWNDFDLPGYISSELGVRTIMDNDANVGALGEGHYGAGQGYDPLFYMTLSTGIGGGIVHKGGVYRGADSYAGEIGHLTIRPDGPECLCGAHGCFERLVLRPMARA